MDHLPWLGCGRNAQRERTAPEENCGGGRQEVCTASHPGIWWQGECGLWILKAEARNGARAELSVQANSCTPPKSAERSRHLWKDSHILKEAPSSGPGDHSLKMPGLQRQSDVTR